MSRTRLTVAARAADLAAAQSLGLYLGLQNGYAAHEWVNAFSGTTLDADGATYAVMSMPVADSFVSAMIGAPQLPPLTDEQDPGGVVDYDAANAAWGKVSIWTPAHPGEPARPSATVISAVLGMTAHAALVAMGLGFADETQGQ